MKIVKLFLLLLFLTSAQGADFVKHGSEKFISSMDRSRYNSNGEFYKFYSELINSIECKDFEFISKNLSYPIDVELDGKSIRIVNSTMFLKNADKIFTGDLSRKILDERENLSYLSKGVIVGRGVLWINVANRVDARKWLVVAINN